jgi:hypothetical protein
MSLDAYTPRTGDLVFFRSRDISLVHDLVSGFTHVGVVAGGADGQEAQLLEMRGNESGVIADGPIGATCGSLVRRIKEFDGDICVAPVVTEVSRVALLRAYQALASEAIYPRRLHAHVAACKLLPGYAPGSAVMMCSEFALRVLAAAGGLQASWRCQTPIDVMVMIQTGRQYGCAIGLKMR